MDVYYAQKFAKYVQSPEADVWLRPNFEAGRNRTSRITASVYVTHSPVTAEYSSIFTGLVVESCSRSDFAGV